MIVATVAFGMGINRSNIRFVIHAAMPKSIEHYQQETGRAGRDGLEAECVLLPGPSDLMTWKFIMEKASEEAPVDPAYLKHAFQHLNDMDRYCRGLTCRHRALVEYFGQQYVPAQPADSGEGAAGLGCAACDLCLGDAEPVPDSLVLAQKLLSCVARVQERYGLNHVVSVLRGENLDKILSLGHDKLSTFGLLREHDREELREWLQQLIGQGVLVREGNDYPILKLNAASWEVMKKQRPVRLLRRRATEQTRKSRAAAESWEGVERDLFDRLCELRRQLAERESVGPYILFSDRTLRELAQVRPSTLAKMKLVSGISEHKLTQYGAALADHSGLLPDAGCRRRRAAQAAYRSNPFRGRPLVSRWCRLICSRRATTRKRSPGARTERSRISWATWPSTFAGSRCPILSGGCQRMSTTALPRQ